MDSVIWNSFYLILLGPFIVASSILLLRAMNRAGSDDEKSRLRYILAVVIIGVFTGLSDLVQILQVPVPPLGHLGCLVYSSILGVAVFKHQEDFDLFAQMRMRLEDLSQMAAAIAHEIRNPLSSIKMASALMTKELQGLNHSTCLEYHTLITEEVERLNHILANFQDFTRPLRVEKDPVSINELIQRTTKLVDVGAPHLEIRVELSADLPRVQAGPSPLLLFGRGDLWPELVSAAAARKIPIAVAGATVRRSSVRLGAIPRLALRAVYRHVTWLGAVTQGDAERWHRLGVAPGRIGVTGDPRHDRILERMADLDPASLVRSWAGDGPVFVAGSVEPGDDAVLAGALVRLATTVPALRTLLVPHDAAEPPVTRIVRGLAGHGLAAGIWRGPHAGAQPEPPIVVAAACGLLADLYLGADIARGGDPRRTGRTVCALGRRAVARRAFPAISLTVRAS